MADPENELSKQARYDRKRLETHALVKLWLTPEEAEVLDELRGPTPRATYLMTVVRGHLTRRSSARKST